MKNRWDEHEQFCSCNEQRLTKNRTISIHFGGRRDRIASLMHFRDTPRISIAQFPFSFHFISIFMCTSTKTGEPWKLGTELNTEHMTTTTVGNERDRKEFRHKGNGQAQVKSPSRGLGKQWGREHKNRIFGSVCFIVLHITATEHPHELSRFSLSALLWRTMIWYVDR